MSSPLFSVIIPVYDRSHVLGRAIESVLAQSYENYEIIVVDDGSTDDLAPLLKRYTSLSNFKLIKQNNYGVSHARNTGAKNAQGKHLAFLDSDDEWLPHKLEVQKKLLDDSAFKLVHGEEIWMRNGIRVNQKAKHLKGGGDQFIPSLEQCLIGPSAAVVEKNLYEELGGFREDFPVCEDYDLWLKITSLMEVGFISAPVVIKHGGASDQLSTKFRGMDYWRCLSIIWTLENRPLNDEQRSEAIAVLRKKLDIMHRGLMKKVSKSDIMVAEVQKVEALIQKARLF